MEKKSFINLLSFLLFLFNSLEQNKETDPFEDIQQIKKDGYILTEFHSGHAASLIIIGNKIRAWKKKAMNRK